MNQPCTRDRLQQAGRRSEEPVGEHRRPGGFEPALLVTGRVGAPEEECGAEPSPEQDGRTKNMDRLDGAVCVHSSLQKAPVQVTVSRRFNAQSTDAQGESMEVSDVS